MNRLERLDQEESRHLSAIRLTMEKNKVITLHDYLSFSKFC